MLLNTVYFRLVVGVFRLTQLVQAAGEAGLISFLSPQVTRSAMFFLKRWATSYLLLNENYYNQVHATFPQEVPFFKIINKMQLEIFGGLSVEKRLIINYKVNLKAI